MKSFISIIKYDYLQRTRSYAFLITLCASLAIGYTFVPEPNANYSTIRIADYVGYYNSAWFGYVTAIMTSIFLSLIGFYLVNSGIKKDMDTRIGLIVASTSIQNYRYLLSKVFSNFLILITIVALVFCMSLVLFFLYNDGYTLELLNFIKPYVVITIPAIFVIAVMAVVFEVLFGRYSIIQNIGFFFVFCVLTIPEAISETQLAGDVFGSKIVINHLEHAVQTILGSDEPTSMNIGYVIGHKTEVKKFEFNGIDFPDTFLISRVLWMVSGILLVVFIAPFFHRFNRKEILQIKTIKPDVKTKNVYHEVSLQQLPKVHFNSAIVPLVKTEMLLLYRNGKRWLWFVNIFGMLLLASLSIEVAHKIVLPILWFLQVARLSEITTKESINNTHYFAFASNKPLRRLLMSQVISGVLLMVFLASPLIIRLLLLAEIYTASLIIIGSLFIVALAFTLGIWSKGKKLFEVLFFVITYTNINAVPFTDYFGAQPHSNAYLVTLLLLVIGLGYLSFFMRNYQLKNM